MGVVQAVRRWLVPGLRSSTWAYREALEPRIASAPRWLDLGCGHQLLPTWMADGESTAAALVRRCPIVVGVDREGPALVRHSTIRRRVAADIERLPFGTGSFDLITANMVIEHVDDARALLAQVHRLLVPGGTFLFHTPNRRFYQIQLARLVPQRWRRHAAAVIEGRELDDVFPTLYRLNTAGDIEAQATAAGFEVERITYANSGLTFGRLPPLALLELGVVRLLETRPLEAGRSNLIAALRKRARS